VNNTLPCTFKIRFNYWDANNAVFVYYPTVNPSSNQVFTLPANAVGIASVQMRTTGGTILTPYFSADYGYHKKLSGGNPGTCQTCNTGGGQQVNFEIAGPNMTIVCGY
jgi:hypothetical protein